MTLDPEASLRALLERLLRDAPARDARPVARTDGPTDPSTTPTVPVRAERELDTTLLAPQAPDPLLVQGGRAFATLALALGLLDELARRGATRWSRSRVDTLRQTVLARLELSHRHHVAAELEAIVTWFADGVLSDPKPAPAPEPSESPGLDAHRALVLEALRDGADLLLEHLHPDGTLWKRLRLRPDALLPGNDAPVDPGPATSNATDDLSDTPDPDDDEDREEEGEDRIERVGTERVVGRRVPEGDRTEIELNRVRWMMVVARLGDLPSPPTLATVHAFPSRPDGDSE